MDGLIELFVGLIGLLLLGLAAIGFGVDSRSYNRPGEMEFER